MTPVRSLSRLVVPAAVFLVVSCSGGAEPQHVPATQSTAPTRSTVPAVEEVDADGALLEGIRLGEFVVLPEEVDPTLTRPPWDTTDTGPLPKNASGGYGFNPAFTEAAERHNMLAGFKTYRGAPQGVRRLSLGIVVMRFRDAETAVRAADDLAEVATTTTGMSDDDVYQVASLAAEPEVRYSVTKREKSVGIRAFTPYHEYVIYTGANAVTEVDAERTTKRAVELQRPLLDSFVATEPAKYAELPIDPEGVYDLALGTGYRREGTYGPRAASLMVYNQPRMLALFGDVGMTAAGVAGTTVYRTRDNTAAQQLATVLSEVVVRHHNYDDQLLAPAATPPDSPNTQCWSTLAGIRSWFCLVTQGRYVGEIWEGSETKAHDLAIQQARVLLKAR